MRQDQAFSYIEPFLVRAESPGIFRVDCGYITSMTINKGGSDNLWTTDGLPRLIECTIDIQDLYPILKQSRKDSMTKYNRGLCAYLENLSGVRAEDLTVGTLANLRINRFVSNSILTTADDQIKNKIDSIKYTATDYIKKLFM